MPRLFDHLYILATMAFTVYGQLILKWRIQNFGAFPVDGMEKLRFLFALFFDPLIFSGFVSAFLASLAWMAAMTKFDLNYAYPFMSINFALVVLLSGWLLNEPVSMQKILGIVLITIGTVVAVRG
ncbi:EamA family transporter [Herbaspirillum sp. RTI4]|uniref:EamA family transporter n=1 Tax=Herbaspirillum sp. RTI4 TaxID=3048640 RepID=UPI002AB3D5BD|nr:EamA family transporter [Herbaspirillum sp. RTI4]MDY7577586.1 EamA family transporter [Herbaspirillum sp. RTI4]MEA9983387.1 EamA family transporter [Herbaspirillum sp. RTI4]